jgi:hypothetical protein
MNATHLLYATAVVLGAGGAALRLLPLERPHITDHVRATPYRITDAAPLSLARATGDIATARSDPIVAANIFSRSRTAPAREGAVVHTAHAPASPAQHAAALTLYGTTIGPQGAVALIDDDTPPRGAHLHHMGDVIAGARLVAITDSTVTLDRQSGPLVLHLPASMRQAP